MKCFILTTGILLAMATSAEPQAPAVTPEHEQLLTLVGAWKADGAFLGGTAKGELICDRFLGGFHVVCRAHYELTKDGATRPYEEIVIWGFHPEEQVYVWQGANSLGWTPLGGVRGKREPNGWSWTHEAKETGKAVMYRWAFLEAKDRFTVKGESAPAGGAWQPFVDCAFTRVR